MTIVYSSFDVFPSPKGAAVHIEAFARALGRRFGGVELLTLAADAPAAAGSAWMHGPRALPLGDGVTHHAIDVRGGDLIGRALSFRTQLLAWWNGKRPHIAHVRGIFEGYPIATRKSAMCERLIYEVNGLPSIELKYHYPEVADDAELLAKLERQERRCLEAADLLVTPSAVTAAELVRRGAAPAHIEVIPNGVEPELFRFRAPRAWGTPLRLLYVGTITSWQGVHHALEALSLLRRDHPAELRLVGPARRKQRSEIERRSRELGIREHVTLVPPLPRTELVRCYHEADVALVPLPFNDRNSVQGCCPLKLLEAMASGVPVVASDLPVVSALARHEQEAVLVRPGAPKAIKDGVLRLLGEPGLAERLVIAARLRIERELTWQHAAARLVEAYARLGMA